MLKRIFYVVKPFVPRSLQILLRKILVQRQIKKYNNVWPIYPGSESKPKNWNGWSDGKKFALVLTHDVELRGGHDKSKSLLALEKSLGFVSSFNFVPERYVVDRELREFIVNEGFEVGVHGLNHDGKLFQSRKIFLERAERINHYLKEWNSVGFRAPAMHHNLNWISELDIEYDLSTFDTDPFEPQSDGCHTIFPFWVNGNNNNPGYVELPYTLVQDFTLFILMGENSPKIWLKKLDWIAENGGMVLVNVHPDYINFDNKRQKDEFPVEYYLDFLNYIKTKYDDKYFNARPKEIASYLRRNIS